jgi:hypothetical protein
MGDKVFIAFNKVFDVCNVRQADSLFADNEMRCGVSRWHIPGIVNGSIRLAPFPNFNPG